VSGPRFLITELNWMESEYFLREKETKDGNDRCRLITEVAEIRVKSYTLEQCIRILKQTSVKSDGVDIGLAIGDANTWLKVIQGIVGFIMSVELEGYILHPED